MKHTVNTALYEQKHGSKPHGWDMWIFTFDGHTKGLFRGLWHDAQQYALRFKRMGVYEKVEVQP